MRNFKVGFTVIIMAVGRAAGQPPPATPTPTPTPVAPTEYPAFDGGTGVTFYAEPNTFIAYLSNPAYFNFLPKTFAGGDFGGDLSFGGFRYTRNGGEPTPGPSHADEETALRVSYTAGLGGYALGAYRRDFWNIGGQAYINRTAASFAYNGPAVVVDSFFSAGEGWTGIDAVSQNYGIVAAGSAAFGPHVAGGSFAFRPERLEGDFDFEYLPPPSEEGTHEVAETWGRREVKDYHLKAGYVFRPEGPYEAGGAVGYRALRSTIGWRDAEAEEKGTTVTDQGRSGRVALKGQGFTVDADGRYMFWEKMRLGGALTMQFLSDVLMDFEGERWDLVGPFGEREKEKYRLAKANENRIRFGGGVAFYPDERTTLAFDYTYDRLTEDVTTYDEDGAKADDINLAAYHTYTQLGVERWVIDNLSVKGGVRQNLFGYPRNVFFAGLGYEFDDEWYINYDYTGYQLTVNDLSLFMPFDEIVKPASHRFTVVRYF